KRKAFGARIGDFCKVVTLNQLLDTTVNLGPRQMVELGVEFEILSNGQFVVERESLRHVADIQARLHVIRPHRLAEQLRGSAGGRKKTSQHFHGGRLAGAVRAEKADNLAALDTE